MNSSDCISKSIILTILVPIAFAYPNEGYARDIVEIPREVVEAKAPIVNEEQKDDGCTKVKVRYPQILDRKLVAIALNRDDPGEPPPLPEIPDNVGTSDEEGTGDTGDESDDSSDDSAVEESAEPAGFPPPPRGMKPSSTVAPQIDWFSRKMVIGGSIMAIGGTLEIALGGVFLKDNDIRGVGLASLIIGCIAVAGSVPMIVFGRREVPMTNDYHSSRFQKAKRSAMIPNIGIGTDRVSLSWIF